MNKRIENEFRRIGKLVQASDIPDDDMLMAVGCLNKLPALCEAFFDSYESRDVEEIFRLERGMLARLAEPSRPLPQARELAGVLSTRLRNLHERLGQPQLTLSKPRPVSQGRSRNPA